MLSLFFLNAHLESFTMQHEADSPRGSGES